MYFVFLASVNDKQVSLSLFIRPPIKYGAPCLQLREDKLAVQTVTPGGQEIGTVVDGHVVAISEQAFHGSHDIFNGCAAPVVAIFCKRRDATIADKLCHSYDFLFLYIGVYRVEHQVPVVFILSVRTH